MNGHVHNLWRGQNKNFFFYNIHPLLNPGSLDCLRLLMKIMWQTLLHLLRVSGLIQVYNLEVSNR